MSDAWWHTNLSISAHATNHDSCTNFTTRLEIITITTQTNRSMRIGAKTFQHFQLARLARALHGSDVSRFRYYYVDICFFVINVSTSSRFFVGTLSNVQLRFIRSFFHSSCSLHFRCIQRYSISLSHFCSRCNDATGVEARDLRSNAYSGRSMVCFYLSYLMYIKTASTTHAILSKSNQLPL